MEITVDRDSVAAGDDVEPHDYRLDVSPETTVDEILRTLRPDVHVAGPASWLVRLGGRKGPAVAVYAAGFGMHVSPEAELPVSSLTDRVIHFDYWAGSPPQLLLDALKRGEEPDRRAAMEEGWRQVFRDRLAAARRDQETSPARVLSPAAVEAVAAFGATLEVHAGDYARLRAVDGRGWVLRTDHRFWIWIDQVEADGMERAIAWFRLPAVAAEPVLAALLGDAWRAIGSLDPVVAPPTTIGVGLHGRSLPQWQWTDESGAAHEVRNWHARELAIRYAPYARWPVERVVAYFTGGSPM